MTNNQRKDDRGSNSSTADSIKLDKPVELSEPSKEDSAGIYDANSSIIKANASTKSNEIETSTCLILQRLTNHQKSQQKASLPRKITKRLQYLNNDESEQ